MCLAITFKNNFQNIYKKKVWGNISIFEIFLKKYLQKLMCRIYKLLLLFC